MFGANITAINDKLAKVQEEYFYNSLIHPKPQNQALISQLRVIYTLDPKQYAKAKKSLPYIVCGIFKPEIRRKENFSYIERFIVDIDKLSSKMMDIAELRQRFADDKRIMLCFTSPSEDGLKLMFRLKEKCYDPGLYSVFYKEFLRRFALQYDIEQVVDRSTSDVSRACFISVDPLATFNPDCEPVDLNEFVNPDDPLQFFDMKHEEERLEKEREKSAEMKEQEKLRRAPDSEVIEKIKQQLGMRSRPKTEKKVFVPEELQAIMEQMREYIEETGMAVKEIVSIQYGKKVRAVLGMRQAEVNIFYGKRGFSVVISPRAGTDEELNNLLAESARQFLEI